MNDSDNGRTALEVAMSELDRITRHVGFLTAAGMTRETIGAENAWLLKAVRVAMTPATTRGSAEFKINLLKGNMYGWAGHASRANGLLGATCLIFGALSAEAHE